MNKTTAQSIFANTSVSALLPIKHGIFLVIAGLLLVLTAYAQADPAVKRIFLGTTSNGMGDVSKQDIELGFNNGLAKFSSGYGFNPRLKVFDSQQELMAAFDAGEIDGIFGLATDILAREDSMKPRLTTAVYDNGQSRFRYFLLVSKANNISSIEQLKGKRISIPRFQEIESLYLNTLLLRHRQVESPQFFSEMLNAANSNITITDLFFGRVDAAIVNENEYRIAIELNPQIGQKTMILEQSEPMILFVSGISKTYPDEFERLAIKASYDFERSEDGRNALKLLGMKGLQAITFSDLDTVRALEAEYQQLKNARASGGEAKSNVPIRKKPGQQSKTGADKML